MGNEMKKEGETTIVFAPHPDDEVLGVGGTISKKSKKRGRVIVCIATDGKDLDTRRDESSRANRSIGVENTIFLGFPDLHLDLVDHEALTRAIGSVIEMYRPDEIFTPHRGDLHTDHKALTSAVLVAIRPKYSYTPARAYTYETLSETGLDYQNPINGFSPDVFVDISDTIEDKVNAMKMHKSQIEEYPNSRCEESIRSLASYRGSQCGMKAAEAFMLLREYVR